MTPRRPSSRSVTVERRLDHEHPNDHDAGCHAAHHEADDVRSRGPPWRSPALAMGPRRGRHLFPALRKVTTKRGRNDEFFMQPCRGGSSCDGAVNGSAADVTNCVYIPAPRR